MEEIIPLDPVPGDSVDPAQPDQQHTIIAQTNSCSINSDQNLD